MKSKVVVCCWNKGHLSELILTRSQEDKLSKQIPKLQAVCPLCRNSGDGNRPIFIKEGATLFDAAKTFLCSSGHVSTISAFNNGMLHVKFGPGSEDFFNIEGTPDELQNLLDEHEIVCHHKECGAPLSAVDDFVMTVPKGTSIKTRTRVGDLWDRNNIEPVRQGYYNSKDGEYVSNRTEIANRERLKKIRQRNVSEDRLPGKRVDKPTDKNYGYKSKDQINF